MLGDANNYYPIARITNLSGGSNSAFKVGDSWRIDVTGGPPNTCVYMNATIPGVPMPMSGQQDLALSAWLGRYTQGLEACGIGKTDSAGNYSTSGTFGNGQVGHWVQTWNIGGSIGEGLDFTVADSSGSTQYGGATNPGGTAFYTLATNHAPTQAAPTGYQSLTDQLAGRAISPTGQLTNPPTGAGPSMSQLPNMPSLTDITNPLQSMIGESSLLLIGGGLLVAFLLFKGK